VPFIGINWIVDTMHGAAFAALLAAGGATSAWSTAGASWSCADVG
jgi:hypothetical protein